MSDLMSLASTGLAMIASVLTVERSLESVVSFTANALEYFSPYEHVDMAKCTYGYGLSAGAHRKSNHAT